MSTDSAPEPNVASSSLSATWPVADMSHRGSSPSEEEAVNSGEATEGEGIRLPLEAAACFSTPRQGGVPELFRTVARPAAAILRALGPPKGTYALAHLYAGPPSHETEDTPTISPHGLESFASSSACVVRNPATIQHHGSYAPLDSAHKTGSADVLSPVLALPAIAVLPPPDPVVRFLEELGLSPSLADSLRRVGISDDNRIRAIGALPRGPMDRIEKGLALEGIDLAACVLIRQGLKQRAMH